MRAVEHDRQTTQAQRTGHRRLAEFRVAHGRVADPHDLADRLGRNGREWRFEFGFDRQFDVVGELLARGGKEFDAVVVMRIMGCADHDACIRAQAAGQVCDRRRRHRPEQADIRASRDQPRLERRLEHVAGNARVLADHDRGMAMGAGQHAPDRATEFQHELGRDRPFADPAANAVGSKVLARAHVGWFCLLQPIRPIGALSASGPRTQTPRRAGRLAITSDQTQSPICFWRCSQRSCASRLSVAIGRASRRSMPMSSSVSSQKP